MNRLGQVVTAGAMLACVVWGGLSVARAEEPAPAAQERSRRTCRHTIDCRPLDVKFRIEFTPVRYTLGTDHRRLPAVIKPVEISRDRRQLSPRFDAPERVHFTIEGSDTNFTYSPPNVRFAIDDTPIKLRPIEPPVVRFHIDETIKMPPEQQMPVIVFKDPNFPPMPPDPPSLELVCREE